MYWQNNELAETVPDGYVGHGNERVTKLSMDAQGNISILDGDGVIEAAEGVITIKIENERTADIRILKVSESGKSLEGAVFAIYTEQVLDTEDILEKDGKKYYYLESKTSDENGEVEFTDLSYGVYYLVEKKAPAGYMLLEDAYRVEIKEDNLEDGVYALEIINSKKGVEIVPTGGKGMGPYVAVAGGLVIIGGAVFLATRQKKRRKKKRRAAAARRRNEQTKKRKK